MKETMFYMTEVQRVVQQQQASGTQIVGLKSFVPDRVSIKRAIPGTYFPDEFESHFQDLWKEVQTHL